MFTLRTALFSILVGCGGTDVHALPPAGVRVASITLTSRSFSANATIPIDNSCDGKDVSPELTWSSPPDGTKTLALVLDEPGASSHTQWLVFDIPPETTRIAEGADVEALGAKTGANDSEDVRYAGPCPPRGELHRYAFHVFAADTILTLPEGASRATFNLALNGHLIGEGTLEGTAAR